MATKLAYDLAAVSQIYTDSQGNQKKKWLNIGKMFASDTGYFLVLEPHVNLAGLVQSPKGGVMVSCFEPKERGSGGQGGPSSGMSGGQPAPRRDPVKDALGDFDDTDIPF